MRLSETKSAIVCDDAREIVASTTGFLAIGGSTSIIALAAETLLTSLTLLPIALLFVSMGLGLSVRTRSTFDRDRQQVMIERRSLFKRERRVIPFLEIMRAEMETGAGGDSSTRRPRLVLIDGTFEPLSQVYVGAEFQPHRQTIAAIQKILS
jgi:hypothetical protein